MSHDVPTKHKRPRVSPLKEKEQAGEKKEKQGSKTSEMKKLEKQLCNCYSLEYAQVSKFEVSPFTALLNLLKSTYEATPEIFRTVVTLLLEYNPNPNVDNRQMTTRCLRVLLDKNPDLADCLISMLPEQPSTQQAYSNPLAALPTKVKPEQWKGAVQSLQPHKNEQLPAAKYYNYSTPAVTAFTATQGIPSKITSNDGQLFQPTLVQPIMGPDNNLMAIRMTNPPSKAPVLLCGPYTMSSSAPCGELATVSSTQQNIVPLVPTKQPGVWNTGSSLSIDLSANTPPQFAVGGIGNKQVQGLPISVPSIMTTNNTCSVTSSAPFQPESIRMRAKRKLAMTESLKLNQVMEKHSVGVKSPSRTTYEIPQKGAETRSSKDVPYNQKVVSRSTLGNPVNVDYAEGNYLACLAQMVEKMPPIPIPEADMVEDMGSAGMDVRISGTGTSKNVFKAERKSATTRVEKAPKGVSGAGAGSSELPKASNLMVKNDIVTEKEDERQDLDKMNCSSMKTEMFRGDDRGDRIGMPLIGVASVSESGSQSLVNSQVSSYLSNKDGDGLHLVGGDTEGEIRVV